MSYAFSPMGTYAFDASSTPGVLRMTLSGTFSLDDMRAFVEAHNAAVDGFRGKEYRVWCDIRALAPLAPDVAEELERAKRHSASQKGFRGSAVHVTSAMVALQHKRTSISSGLMDTELISDDEDALRAHLSMVRRSA